MGIRIEKAWYYFGSPIVIYPCPCCDHELKSPVADIGQEDTCSECDQGFEVPGDVEYQAYVDARKPKLKASYLAIPTIFGRKSHSDYVETHIKNIARLEKAKVKAFKENRMDDYATSVFDQANSYEQIAETYGGDEDDEAILEKIVNANFLESTKMYIAYVFLLINGAWNAMDKNDSVWNKDMGSSYDGGAVFVLQPYSGMNGDLRQLEGLFIEVTTKMQKSLKCPISPQRAWNKFAKSMKSEKDFIRQNFFTE
jgi:hypothetical protein